jgi:hypothetical protein
MNTNGYAGYGFKLCGSKGHRTKVPDQKEQQVMRWIVEQRHAGWTPTAPRKPRPKPNLAALWLHQFLRTERSAWRVR